MARSAIKLIERVRKICMALPEATEKLSNGEPTWFAGKGRAFAMLDDHHHGAAHLSIWTMVERLVRDGYLHVATRKLAALVGPGR